GQVLRRVELVPVALVGEAAQRLREFAQRVGGVRSFLHRGGEVESEGRVAACMIVRSGSGAGLHVAIRRATMLRTTTEETMVVRVVRLGTDRAVDEGLRIGTVRRPPRGVPKSEFASRNWYDVWFPNLAPSVETMKQAQQA